MKTFWKVLVSALILGFMVAIIGMVIKGVSTNYIAHASFITLILISVALITVFVLLAIGLKHIWQKGAWMLLILAFPLVEACSYAKSNQKVLISTDCGITWEEVKAGESVPWGTGNKCFIKLVIPNYPMQGDSKFICNFDEKVRATTILDYDYSITDGKAFIKQAKSLGRANSDADDDIVNTSAFESAENSVIDVRLRDVVKAVLLKENIVDADQADLENLILLEANKILAPFGVQLNFITLTFDLDEQTRQAIDVATAMKIYESKGITDIGKLVMAARAGATKITVETKIPEKKLEE
jgi:hypothetical protein